MEQHRISGVGGLSVEAIQNAEEDKRAFWIMSHGIYHRLYTKEFKYSSPTSEDPLDTTSGTSYKLGKGEYNGFSWIKYLDQWVIIYSINKLLHILRINPNKKEIYEQRCLNISGHNPQIFINGNVFCILFLVETKLIYIFTSDFNIFSLPKPAETFTDSMNFFIKDTSLNVQTYFNMNNYIQKVLGASIKPRY